MCIQQSGKFSLEQTLTMNKRPINNRGTDMSIQWQDDAAEFPFIRINVQDLFHEPNVFESDFVLKKYFMHSQANIANRMSQNRSRKGRLNCREIDRKILCTWFIDDKNCKLKLRWKMLKYKLNFTIAMSFFPVNFLRFIFWLWKYYGDENKQNFLRRSMKQELKMQ